MPKDHIGERMKAYTPGQGSIICFPCSQKFMSAGFPHWDWSITAPFLPQWELTARNSSFFSIYPAYTQERNLIKTPSNHRRRKWKILHLQASCGSGPPLEQADVSRRSRLCSRPPPRPDLTVQYWLSDNAPLVECIYYASLVNNLPKWESKSCLLKFLRFILPPAPPNAGPGKPTCKHELSLHDQRTEAMLFMLLCIFYMNACISFTVFSRL